MAIGFKGALKSGLFLSLLVGILVAGLEGIKSAQLSRNENQFLWGIVFTPEVNGRSLDSQIKDLKDLGVNCAKFWLDWNWIEPNLAAAADLSMEDLSAHPEIIDEYAFPEKPGSRFQGLLDYSKTDRLVRELNAAGIAPFPLIADASAAPGFSEANPEERIAPEPRGFSCSTKVAGEIRKYRGIGRDQYLAHIYLLSAGLARRYSRPPMKVEWWNTENELNWTYIHTTVAGWRCGKSWSDQEFLTDLLRMLYLGIKAGNPEAKSTMNVNIHDPNWLFDLSRWPENMDALGLGSYPNYLFATPKMDGLLTSAVRQAVARGQNLTFNFCPSSLKSRPDPKPVFILETGYPSGPKNLGWNELRQAQYISESISGAIRQGARAYIYFKLDDTDLAISPGNLQKVENHWGLVRLDGTRKPGFEAFKKAIADHSRAADPAK